MGVFLIMHHGTIFVMLNGLNHLAEARRFSASCIVIISKGNTFFLLFPRTLAEVEVAVFSTAPASHRLEGTTVIQSMRLLLRSLTAEQREANANQIHPNLCSTLLMEPPVISSHSQDESPLSKWLDLHRLTSNIVGFP